MIQMCVNMVLWPGYYFEVFSWYLLLSWMLDRFDQVLLLYYVNYYYNIKYLPCEINALIICFKCQWAVIGFSMNRTDQPERFHSHKKYWREITASMDTLSHHSLFYYLRKITVDYQACTHACDIGTCSFAMHCKAPSFHATARISLL